MKVELFITIIVLYALETWKTKHIDEWQMMRNKARHYLKKMVSWIKINNILIISHLSCLTDNMKFLIVQSSG